MTPSLKAIIEQEAESKAPKVFSDFKFYYKNGYIAGATPYAEKWEAAEQENKRLRGKLENIEKEATDAIAGKLVNTEVKSDMALYNIKWTAHEALKPA